MKFGKKAIMYLFVFCNTYLNLMITFKGRNMLQ